MSKMLIVSFSFLLFHLQCIDNKPPDSDFTFNRKICLYNSSLDWTIQQMDTNSCKFRISPTREKKINSGNIIFVDFDNALNIKSLKLIYANRKNKQAPLAYKLYLNHRFAGKFFENQNIKIDRNIFSFRMEIIKTGSEKTIRAWDNDFYYFMISDTSLKMDKEIYSEFIVDSLNPYLLVKNNSDRRKSSKPLISKEFDFPDILNKPNVMIRKDRKSHYNYEDISFFNNKGEFQIHHLKANRKTRQIVSDYFYHGNFKCNFNENQEKLIQFSGKISGFSENQSWETEKKHVLVAKIVNNSLIFKDIGENIEFGLPDNAMANINCFDESIIVDIPYATKNNLIGKKLYPCNKCFLRYATIKALMLVHKELKSKGLRIKLLDCYRPYYVQKILFKAFPVKGYIADTIGGSIHNRGTAVDITLTDMDGNELEMGSEYDEFSARSHTSYKYLPDSVINRRNLLHQIMKSFNFVPIRMEWWHFELFEARKYSILNDSLPCANDW